MTEVQLSEIRTADRDVAAAAINRIAAHRPRISFQDPAAVAFWIRSGYFDGLSGHLLSSNGVTYGASISPSSDLLGIVLVDGRGRVCTAKQEVILGRSDGVLYPCGVPIEVAYKDSACATVRVPFAYVGQVAEETTGLPAVNLRFESMTPMSETMRRFWVNTTGYLSRQLTSPDVEVTPLIAEQFKRLGATAILSVFPNTTMTAARLPSYGRAAPALVRRAMAHMETNASQPMTVGEVASTVGLSARALQEAFRRHLNTTPLGYLRRVRLDHVHRELQAGDPTGGATVAVIAHRWGFGNLGRFAREYRTAYGQLPSETLRA